jgi:hypothetical protein
MIEPGGKMGLCPLLVARPKGNPLEAGGKAGMKFYDRTGWDRTDAGRKLWRPSESG